MKTRSQRFFTNILRLRFLVWVGIGLVCVSAVWYYSEHTKAQFVLAYTRYSVAASLQQNAAFTPGSKENPLRESLNQSLARILTKETTSKDRLSLAHGGLQLIQHMNKEVDDIGTNAKLVENTVAYMDTAAHAPGNILRRHALLEIVRLAKKQMSTIENIRGLSYRANFEIAQVCSRIIADKGLLTNAYTIELNNKVPEVEAQFNLRQNSYADLETSMGALQKAMDTLTHASS